MAKLYYRFGQMNASKSIQLLTVAHNYEEQGKKVTLFTPAIDARFGRGRIASRVGIAKDATIVEEGTNLYDVVQTEHPDCVLVDEVQFLGAHHVRQLSRVVDELNIPVIMYGLLKDYRNQFFEGSEAAVLWADQIEEIKTICADPDCNRKATMILKLKDGKPVYQGEQIEVGGNELYRSVCRRHYFNPNLDGLM
ncbi:thymidine kinase [Alicyclobacillus dauci]|uniref:Thymidine kinase n=1 Tax=Alicyclobacillus dauci TaxID=1475485 RepID=A0ABY6Z5D2_9BACL|nr:thymidine kinase [Alicyclobacillus dauci]WAH37235.1 thymidine kinase [Alicyclobacillus dauci]